MWDIDEGGTEANDASAIGRTGRGTTAVLTGRCSRPPPTESVRARSGAEAGDQIPRNRGRDVRNVSWKLAFCLEIWVI
jgi:hypothetical protein